MTWTIILSTSALLILYDFWVFATYGVDQTISRVTLYKARLHPIIPFALGLLFGHIFWPQP
jgi:hypothetical protein